ncbi:MAG: UDP-N-acetylmuramate dehydrogenase [Clostridium sp.]|nr:UDP-N-acetylmuramate dehydrogenase [Clostridium sp.]
MNQYKKFENLFKEFYKSENVILNAEMKNYVHFRVGGPADILLIPENKEQVIKSIEICNKNNIPYFIVGNGSNLLVKDGGVKGVVIKLNEVNNINTTGEIIEAECGAMLKDISSEAVNNSLTGFEFACGIPGTVGGAVFMNAGAYDGEISNVIESAEVIDNNGKIVELSKEELELGYRSSIIMKRNYVVLSAKFRLQNGEVKKIKEMVEDLTCRRESKQPLEYPSAGSTFKRPVGYFAGKLIQDAGLKGHSIGGAAVSEKHSGFVINKNNATAKDILDLIIHIQDTVKEKFGVQLHPEVRIIGEDKTE